MMNEKEIDGFSIKQILAHSVPQDSDALYEGCLLISGGDAVRKEEPRLMHPCRLNAVLLMLCTEGEADLLCNVDRYTLRRNMLFCCRPGNIFHMVDNRGARGRFLLFDPEFLGRLTLDVRRILPVSLQMHASSPCIPLESNEVRRLSELLDSAACEIRESSASPYYHDLVKCSLETLLYKVMSIFTHHADPLPVAQTSVRNRNEEYFKAFMIHLAQHYKSERSVGFYAELMNLSPKYLTTLIKQFSGRSVAEWIDEYVILEAKNLLRYSDMSIQQVGYYLNFPNQSFFGKYFKQHTGMSPSAYKMQC